MTGCGEAATLTFVIVWQNNDYWRDGVTLRVVASYITQHTSDTYYKISAFKYVCSHSVNVDMASWWILVYRWSRSLKVHLVLEKTGVSPLSLCLVHSWYKNDLLCPQMHINSVFWLRPTFHHYLFLLVQMVVNSHSECKAGWCYLSACMYYMYVLHVCTTCMYYMYVLHVCTTCMYYMYVLHVCTFCCVCGVIQGVKICALVD